MGGEHHEEVIYVAPHTCAIYTHKYDFLLNNSQHIYVLIFIHVNILSCYILTLVLTYFWMTKDHVTFLDLKQLLRVSCILWCYFSKWYSIIVNKDFIVDQLALGREHHEKAIYIAPHICIIYVLKYDFLLNSSQHMHIFRCINVQIYMYVLIDAVIL